MESDAERLANLAFTAAAAGDLAGIRALIEGGVEVDAVNNDGWTMLMFAADNGEFEMVKYLVNQGAEVNAISKNGWTPVMHAALNGSLGLVKYLEDQGADIKAVSKEGSTLLMHAASNGNTEVVIHLLDQGADANAFNESGWTPLAFASQDGNMDIVKKLVENGADVSATINDGSTPVIIAATNGNLEVVKYLEARGADLSAVDKYGSTTLMLAAIDGELEVIKYLVDRGANMNAANKFGSTALLLAALNGKLEVVKYLVDRGADMNAINKGGMTAMEDVDVDIVKVLIDRGADIDSTDNHKWTLLMKAAWSGKLEKVKQWVNLGANVKAVDKNGNTPFMLAASKGALEVVKYFAEQGLVDDDVNKDVSTPLIKAASSGNWEVVKCLVDRGADVNAVNKYGLTPLAHAADRSAWNMVEYLVDQGANVEAVCDNGSTPLILAAKSCEWATVKYLVDLGADVNATDNNGWSALSHVVEKGELEVARFLTERGANVECMGKAGKTPLVYAVVQGNLEIVKCLVNLGADVNTTDSNKKTPLMISTSRGDLEVVKFLVESGANLNVVDEDGSTPLMIATWNDELEVLKYLVEQGSDIHTVDNDESSLLMIAAIKGKLNVVKYLVELGTTVNGVDKTGMTPVAYAASKGKWDVVRYLVDQGAVIETDEKQGIPALAHAANYGNIEMIEYLVDHGADVNVVDEYGMTPLLYTVGMGKRRRRTWVPGVEPSTKLEIAKFLLARGADVNAVNNDGVVALAHAASEGDLDMVKCLVDHGANVNVAVEYEDTSLMRAAIHGHVEVVKFLLDRGANLDAVNDEGSTALAKSAWNFKWDMVTYLVDAGANVNTVNKHGMPPLAFVTEYGELEMVKYLVNRGADVNTFSGDCWTPLMCASKRGALEIAVYLVNQGANVNAVGKDGKTSLIIATIHNNFEIVKYLLNQGADANVVDNGGKTALIYAASNGNHEVVTYLVDSSADVNTADQDGMTPLLHAVNKGDTKTVVCLVDRGADCNAVDKDGVTPLILAAKAWNKLEEIEYLVSHGANLASVDCDGKTSLAFAVDTGNGEVVKYLIDQGADPNTVDNEGMTSLMRAVAGGNFEIVKFLVSRDADVSLKTTKGQTAAYQAMKHGFIEIRDFLLPYIQKTGANDDMGIDNLANVDTSTGSLNSFIASRSWTISPFDIALVRRDDTKTIGGEYCAKWMEADVVVKLFAPGASASTFEDEVTTWHQLRHPNIIKLYGACNVGHSFFVLENSTNGSVVEFLAECKRKELRRMPWKFMYEAALGLAYLHERGIVHGNLRSSNILVGSDGVAKLADFGVAITSSRAIGSATTNPSSFGSIRWQAPEQMDGGAPSFAADIYSFGLCVLEAVTGREPWEGDNDWNITRHKKEWNLVTNPASSSSDSGRLDVDTRRLIPQICAKQPNERLAATAVAQRLEQLAAKEAKLHKNSLPKTRGAEIDATEYNSGVLTQLSASIRDTLASERTQSPTHELIMQEIDAIHEQLLHARKPLHVLEAYHSLLVDLNAILQSGSLQNRVAALTATRATTTNLTVFRRRVNDLWMMIDESRVGEAQERWNSLRSKQLELFVSEVSETVTVLGELNDEATRSEFVALLKSEIDRHDFEYTDEQLAVMKKAFDDCCRGEWAKSVATTPVWFLPWRELVIDRMKKIGEGGFGDVYLAKWLDSEVVVKEVKSLGLTNNNSDNSMASTWLDSASQWSTSISGDTTNDSLASRKALRAMFEQEVNVWFALSHPHVVRLFGACHIGTPFFACEYADGGSLDKYLRKHPDEIWTKLLEAALGVQYLQSRNIVHGDLKCNNIMVGADGKAKVTDFGLSSFEEADASIDLKMSGAWQWVAPECIEHGAMKRSFASDVYSLGMCIVEALRVVECVKRGTVDCDGAPPLPWGSFDNATVKHYVSRQKLPQRPQLCTDEQWQLIERMCSHDPADRISILTVVDELDALTHREAGRDAEAAEPECELQETESSLVEGIVEMENKCRQLLGSAGSHDRKVLCRIYELLWTRLGQLTTAREKGAACVEDTKSLSPLVTRSRESMRMLEKQNGACTLVAFTETAFRGYTLHRDLDKVIAAK